MTFKLLGSSIPGISCSSLLLLWNVHNEPPLSSVRQKVHSKCQITSPSLVSHTSVFPSTLPFHLISVLSYHIKDIKVLEPFTHFLHKMLTNVNVGMNSMFQQSWFFPHTSTVLCSCIFDFFSQTCCLVTLQKKRCQKWRGSISSAIKALNQ